MLKPEKIEAIIFDVDGTLRDTDDEMVRRIELLLLHLEFLISSKRAKNAARRFVMSMEDPAQALLHYTDEWGWDAFIHKTIQGIRRTLWPLKHNEQFQSIAGIQTMIPELARRYPLSVASAGSAETVQAYLASAGIEPYFRCVASALTCIHTKPFADPLLWCAVQMGVDPSRCLMVGDTTVDILAGKNAGTYTAGVLCGFGEKSELEALSPDLLFNSTADLLQWIDGR